MKAYILVLDHGTTGVKACLMNRDGQIISFGYQAVPQIYPQPGWVEHDPDVLWELTLTTVEEAFAKAGCTWQDIDAIGITNQRETVILWDKETGRSIHNAIVWQCRRTANWCNEQKKDARLTAMLQQRTGLVLDAYFSASKIMWLFTHCEQAKPLAEKGQLLFGTVDTWILWKLTGGTVHATDYTNASRTMLFNIQTKTWDPELLNLFHVPESILPTVQNTNGLFGTTNSAISGGVAVPIMAMVGDQQSALYGQKCWTPGSCKNTFGTGAFLMMNLGDQCLFSDHGLLTTLACDDAGKPVYALEGAIFIAGAAMEWLKNNLGLFDSFEEVDELAHSLDSNEGVYFVPAFVGLGAPYWDSEARGQIIGLTQGSGKAHLTRAGLEAMAYQTDDVVTLMQQASGLKLETLKVDGGVSRSEFLMQYLADLLDVAVHRMNDAELTAKGAGYLAGLASGFWQSATEILAQREASDLFIPAMGDNQRNISRACWKDAVQRTLSHPQVPAPVGS